MGMKFGVVVAALVLGLTGSPVDGLAAEEETVRAVAAWSGQGWFFPSGPEEALFAGVLRGILFVENSRGALDAVRMVCPIKLEMHRVSGSQTGEGRCLLTSRDQHQVFAHFTCTGTYGSGCQGRFTLTGGTGSFKGITGEGDVTLRSALHEQAAQPGTDAVREAGTGIAVWHSLRYRIP